MLLTSMLPILMSFAATSAPDTGHVLFASPPLLHTPEAIAPAVLPYLDCLFARRGVPFLKVTLGNPISYDTNDRDCSATRKRAKADALRMLEHARVPGSVTPTAYIENALSNMDAYVASLPERSVGNNSANSSRSGLSIAMEDEVEPAFHRYSDCLMTQIGYTSVAADSIMAIFQQVMTICRSVRDAAVIEAENALEKKGWDVPTRTKTAEETFAAADDQWLSMGTQYRDYLNLRARGSDRKP